MDIKQYTADFLGRLAKREPAQKVFQQAVHEVVGSLAPVLEQNPKYIKESILDRILEPERMIIFRVPWKDDKGNIHVNRGFRIQYNSALGPYKGGMRFHETVNQDALENAFSFDAGTLELDMSGMFDLSGMTMDASALEGLDLSQFK